MLEYIYAVYCNCFVLQIAAEFHRISNINLKNRFYAELDRHAPRLQILFRKRASRTGKGAEVLSHIFTAFDLQVSLIAMFCFY